MIARLEINNQNFDRLKVVVDGHHSNMKVKSTIYSTSNNISREPQLM